MPFWADAQGAVAGLLSLAVAVAVGGIGSQPGLAASLNAIAVEVTNASEPVLCAEKDNVTLAFASPRVRSFRIEAAHPVYMAGVQRDSFEADWTACDMRGDPVHASAVTVPTRRTLYEEPALWVVGWTFPTFWRPATAKVVIGGKTFEGLHMLQVWTIRPMGGEEVLVVYPQDGYWRIRPKAPTGLAPTAFGSSFLIGPVEDAGRPIVAIDTLTFDPAAKAFDVAFTRGGTARLSLVRTDERLNALDVTFDKPVAGAPFAMLRSMYVTGFNNDAADVAVREAGARGWREAPIMAFDKALATDIWLGRRQWSQHNTSSPDHVLNGFSAGDRPALPVYAAPKP